VSFVRHLVVSLATAAVVVGCGVPPSDECVQYVACQDAYDETFNIRVEEGGIDTRDYEPGGACWADLTTAQTCTDNCTRAIESLRTAAAEGGETLDACEP
jgi:hypothetical protein